MAEVQAVADDMGSRARTGVRHPGLILGVARFYHDPRGSVQGMLDSHPSEARLMAYAFVAATILLAGRLVEVLMTEAGNVLPRMLEQIGSTLFFVPLAYYGIAALGTMIAQACGGQGGWADGRKAFFWAALVSAPLVAVSELAPALAANAPVWQQNALAMLGPLVFGVATAFGFTIAFGFRKVWTVIAAMSAPVLFFMLAALLLRG